MRKPVVLITGAGGEIGHGLIEQLSIDGTRPIITLDVAPLEPTLAKRVARGHVREGATRDPWNTKGVPENKR